MTPSIATLSPEQVRVKDLPLVARFNRKRWTPERVAIDAMKAADTLAFTEAQYFNVKSSVERLNDAYEGTRVWKLITQRTTDGFTSTVTYSEL